MLLTALIAIGVQMDRQARRDSALADIVPPIFRAYALEPLARASYARGDNEQGLSYSRQLVLRRPVPAESLALLTSGLVGAGDDTRAIPTLLLSAQRGWRDPYTQRMMIIASQQTGEYKVAVQRLFALWREGDESPDVRLLTREVLSTPQGMNNFADGFIVGDSFWATNFMVWAASALPNASIEALSHALLKKRVEVDCVQLSPITRVLVHTGKVSAATTMWSKLCSDEAITQANDFNFNSLRHESGPYDWRLSAEPGIEAEFINKMSKVILRYNNSLQIRAVVAERTTSLAKGMHTASVGMRSLLNLNSSGLLLRITCISPAGRPNGSFKMEIGHQSVPFEIPSLGCPTQEIALLVRHGEGNINNVTIQ